MSNEPNDPIFVDPNTDNLDSFTDLFNGKAQEKVEDEVKSETVEPVQEIEPEEVDDQDSNIDAPDGEGEDEEPEVKPKKVNRFQERINELTAKAKEAERALEALKAEKSKQQVETPRVLTPVVQDDSPDPDAKNEDGSDKYPLGEFDPAYVRDMARNTINREWQARKEQEAAEQVKSLEEQARAEIQNQWVEKLAPVTEQYEDYIDKTMQLESAFDGLDVNYSDYLVQTIKSLDHGPEVLYYLANNLEEAHKYVQSGPLGATLALGELNAMFKGQTRKTEANKVSKAPPPPQVNKGSKTRVSFSPDTDDLDAFADHFFKKPGR